MVLSTRQTVLAHPAVMLAIFSTTAILRHTAAQQPTGSWQQGFDHAYEHSLQTASHIEHCPYRGNWNASGFVPPPPPPGIGNGDVNTPPYYWGQDPFPGSFLNP